LHTPIYDLDESSLAKGAAILTQTALNFLKKESHSPINIKTEVQIHVS
jgi:hypothetical protein